MSEDETALSEFTHALDVERCEVLFDADMAELCEATDAAIIEGGGFGWVEPQGRAALTRHFRGVLLVPERELFIARLDGHVVGSAQLVRPPRNNEAQAVGAQLTHAYLAPYARGGKILGKVGRGSEQAEERISPRRVARQQHRQCH